MLGPAPAHHPASEQGARAASPKHQRRSLVHARVQAHGPTPRTRVQVLLGQPARRAEVWAVPPGRARQLRDNDASGAPDGLSDACGRPHCRPPSGYRGSRSPPRCSTATPPAPDCCSRSDITACQHLGGSVLLVLRAAPLTGTAGTHHRRTCLENHRLDSVEMPIRILDAVPTSVHLLNVSGRGAMRLSGSRALRNLGRSVGNTSLVTNPRTRNRAESFPTTTRS
jgi:hypothetical protein